MAFQTLVSPSLTDLFVEQVQGMILSGELKVGEKLPTERELAATMKVSLAVVIGEIGLDCHYKREEQHRLKQHIRFLYQLNLAFILIANLLSISTEDAGSGSSFFQSCVLFLLFALLLASFPRFSSNGYFSLCAV